MSRGSEPGFARIHMQLLRSKGFTLIELTIVIVIIGLLAAGIVVGRDMIRQTELRSVIKEREQLEAALNTFRLKYNCMAGDCRNASQYFSGSNGDGNLVVNNNNISNPELYKVFDHLVRAGLISGVTNPMDMSTYPDVNGTPVVVPGFNIPASKYPGAGYVFFNPGEGVTVCSNTISGNAWAPEQCNRHIIVFGGEGSGHNWWFRGGQPQPVFPCQEIMSLDSKYDDGKPFTGHLQMPGANLIGGSCYTGAYPSATYNISVTTTKGIIAFVTGH